MLKEKLGLCPYEVICNEKDFTLMSEIQDEEIIQESDEELIETKSLKKNENTKESDEELIGESDEELIETKSLKKKKKMKMQQIGMIKISLKKYQLLLTTTNLITKIKQVNSSIMTLKTWLIILTIIQLVKHLLNNI